MTVPLLLGGCKDKPIAGYVPASSFSKKGFAKNREQVLALRGKVLKVWGYVDGGNVFPKDWGTNQPGKWRFKLKSKPSDEVGQSFSIHIPVDDRHDELVALFEATDFADKPTRLCDRKTIYLRCADELCQKNGPFHGYEFLKRYFT